METSKLIYTSKKYNENHFVEIIDHFLDGEYFQSAVIVWNGGNVEDYFCFEKEQEYWKMFFMVDFKNAIKKLEDKASIYMEVGDSTDFQWCYEN